jgi:type IV pilus assembly protein PilM
MGSTRTPLFFKDKPLFGLDIGTGSMKVMQIGPEAKKRRPVVGYGMIRFDGAKSMKEGEIIDFQTVAKAAKELFQNQLVGDITTRRVALSVPTFRTYTREMQLPKVSDKELAEAVQAEAEQYIPRPLDELYLDHTITARTDNEIMVYMVAVSKNIVDSYTNLMNILGLEVVFIEPSILASTRLLGLDTHNEIPGVLVDFGTRSADVSIFDNQRVTVTGTVESGGDLFTEHIKAALHVSHEEAALIKTKYGLSLSKKQKEIRDAVEPLLSQTIKEVKRMVRYYEERSDGKNKIGQVITMGGGANMPGLNDYLTEHLRMPVRMFDPWQVLDYGKLQPPSYAERSMYMTVAGLGLVHSKGVIA